MNNKVTTLFTLAQIEVEKNRISFIFNSPLSEVNPVRTCNIVNSTLDVRSLFDIYSEEIHGRTIDLFSIDVESLVYLLKESAKEKKFKLEISRSFWKFHETSCIFLNFLEIFRNNIENSRDVLKFFEIS